MSAVPVLFPVMEIIPDLKKALAQNARCLLIAPPGAGKTTLVPPALLGEDWLNGHKIIMLEPRRLAARRSAEYMSEQRGENCGDSIGYRIRMETRVSAATRIEVVTEGILTRMLQADPELPDTGIVIFDEYHERGIHTDTGLAFVLDVQKNLRPDLRILIMSATPDKEKLLSLLGDIPVIESGGKMFHVDTRYLKHESDKRLEIKTAEAVLRALRNDLGDILVFLPGKAEIKRVHQLLEDPLTGAEVEIHELYGELTRAQQDAALLINKIGRRKVILATSIAETSLTIDGVRVVIDSGVSRVSAFDARRGMSGLKTIPVSRATADQRRGRAGRQAEGVCYRLWTRAEEYNHPLHPVPEILSSDLTPLALELAQWGTPRGEGLDFPDPPPGDLISRAVNVLRMLGATDDNNRLTDFGRQMCRLSIHPRLSAMILKSVSSGCGYEACLLAALLEEHERSDMVQHFDIQEYFDYRIAGSKKKPDKNTTRIFEHADRISKTLNLNKHLPDKPRTGKLLAMAYPDRIAKRLPDNRFQLAQGTVVTLPEDSRLGAEEFLVVSDVDGAKAVGRAFHAAPVCRADIIDAAGSALYEESVVQWIDDAVRGKKRLMLGALSIQEKDFQPGENESAACIIEQLRAIGLDFLTWSKDAVLFRSRSEWYRQYCIDPADTGSRDWPLLTEEALLGKPEKWLLPFLTGIKRKRELEALDTSELLKSVFTYEQLQKLDRMAPQFIEVPSGSKIQIRYDEGEKPILAVRLQELFGLTDTPLLGGGKIAVLIHLLSPAMRPLAITQDLRSFWKNTYPEILKQMRMKYHKHVWPDDPLAAEPTNRTKKGTRLNR